jgi:signal transduction histidine kinase
MKNNSNISRIINRLSLVLALLLACIPPLTYGVFSYQYLQGALITEAEINSRIVNEIINNNPALWKYETLRLEEILSRRPGSGDNESRRVVDLQGRIVAASEEPLSPPLVMKSHAIMDSGEEVGRIQIIRSLKPLLLNTGIFCVVGLSLGLGCIVLIRIPVRALLQVQKEREQLSEDLKQKNSELERFIYTVSHDLKSPLITISGFADLTERDLNSGDQVSAKNNLAIIKQSALRMRRLLDELLEISRIGVKKNTEEVVNIGTLIQASTDNLSGMINEFKATIEVESELPDVMVDKQRFLQVFENLIANGLRYSKEAKGGSVVKAGVIRGVGELTCYVKDNGIGIEPAYLEKIFGLFERLDANSDGTGVGLAIVKRIIETHGGRIWAESEGLGHGTTLFFTLPEAKQ